MLHYLGWCDLKDCRWDLRLALLYKIVTGHVAINPDQIRLVAADNRTRANHRYKFRAIGASSTGLRYSFAVRTVSDWNQLPAVVVEQENPAAFKGKLSWPDVRLFACHDPPPPLAWYSTRRSADHCARQDMMKSCVRCHRDPRAWSDCERCTRKAAALGRQLTSSWRSRARRRAESDRQSPATCPRSVTSPTALGCNVYMHTLAPLYTAVCNGYIVKKELGECSPPFPFPPHFSPLFPWREAALWTPAKGSGEAL